MRMTLTSHVLDAVTGRHAAGLGVTVSRVFDGQVVAASVTDQTGRFQIELDVPAEATPRARRHVVRLDTTAYWPDADLSAWDVEISFIAGATGERLHMPILIAPHSYNCWWSS